MNTNFEFKTFNIYQNNEAVLNADLKVAESLNQNFHTAETEKFLAGLRSIQKNFSLISNVQSAAKLTQKFNEFGWKNLEKMSVELQNTCEGDKSSLPACLKKADSMISFVTQSNLSDEHKVEVSRELDFYKTQQSNLNKFDSNFAQSFNQLSVVNSNMFQNKFGIKPVIKKIDSPSKIQLLYKKNGIDFAFAGILFALVVALLIVSKKYSESRFKKKFYKAFFTLQKLSGVKVRLFGVVGHSTQKKLSVYANELISILSKKRTFFGELHFKFKENKNVIKLDTHYLSKDSLHFFYEETSGEISAKIKHLIAEIEDAGGEVIFSTQFDGEGSITGSNITFYLPNN